ncbi:MAG: glycoside hydrolase family 19 protein [Hyphomicrobiales bacterium]|nr:glycoside hydrolase family 19 protein [Hyphomicrobiales bacterium]
MSSVLTSSLLHRLAPNARAAYLTALDRADVDLAPFGIPASALRLAHFLAQICHETDGLTIRVESLNYSEARLPQVWPSRFRDPAVAATFAHAPERLAEHVYGGRMGNGPEGAGDGWRYIGRGLLQITGRESYERYGAALGIPLAEEPDLAFSAVWSAKIAAAEWAASTRKGRTCNEMADADDVEGVTRAINGGLVGFSSRKDWLRRWKTAFGI